MEKSAMQEKLTSESNQREIKQVSKMVGNDQLLIRGWSQTRKKISTPFGFLPYEVHGAPEINRLIAIEKTDTNYQVLTKLCHCMYKSIVSSFKQLFAIEPCNAISC